MLVYVIMLVKLVGGFRNTRQCRETWIPIEVAASFDKAMAIVEYEARISYPDLKFQWDSGLGVWAYQSYSSEGCKTISYEIYRVYMEES